MKMIFLVDGDNNIGTGLQGIELLTEEDSVLVFYGRGQSLAGIQKLCANTRAKVQYLESVKGGKNSIDFQIITELGVLVGRGEADFAYVISQDKGYEAAISALWVRYADTFREVALRPSIQSCLRASFLMRTASREELAQALRLEFGQVQGDLAYAHLEELFAPPAPAEEKKPAPAPVQKKKQDTRPPRAGREKQAARRQLTICETGISKLEERCRQLDAEMEQNACNVEKLQELYREKQEVEARLEQEMARWEELSLQLEE